MLCSHFSRPGSYKKNQFPCQYPGLCTGKVSVFGRPADLERHYKNVHVNEKDSFPCDYRTCPRSQEKNSFMRKDHYRDHLRDYHKEDIGCAKGGKSLREKDKLKWQESQRLWLDERNISCIYWRCARCLIRNNIEQQGWECLLCKSPCEEDRVRARMNLDPGMQTPKDCSEVTMLDGAQYAAPYCSTCHGSFYIDYGYGAGASMCPDCNPAVVSTLSVDTAGDSTHDRGVSEEHKFETFEDEEGADTLTTGLDPKLHEKKYIEQPSHSQTPKKIRLSSSVDSLFSASGSIFSVASTADTELSSYADPMDVIERLVSMLWADLELQALFREGMQKTTLDRCERNFRRSLILCSAQLRAQALTLEEQQLMRCIKNLAGSTAHLFRARMDFQTGRTKSTKYRSAEADNYVEDLEIEDNFDDAEGSEDGLDETEIKFQSLERFLQGSNALLALKDNFGLFVHPNPVRKAMLEVWPPSYPRRSCHCISYQIKWELPELLKRCFSKGQRLGEVMTITSEIEQGPEGDLPNAQVTSCRDYLSSNWLNLGIFLLGGLETLFDTLKPGQGAPNL
jgi:hypothetical protein